MTERFIRREETSHLTGLPVSTIYQQIGEGKFPKPVRISPRLVAWRESELIEWMKAKVAERDASAHAARFRLCPFSSILCARQGFANKNRKVICSEILISRVAANSNRVATKGD